MQKALSLHQKKRADNIGSRKKNAKRAMNATGNMVLFII